MDKDLDVLIQETIDQIRKNGDAFVIPDFLLNVPTEVAQRWQWELLQSGPFVAAGHRGLTLSALGQTIVRDHKGNWKKYLRAQRFNQKRMFWVAVIATTVSLISVFTTFLRKDRNSASEIYNNFYHHPCVQLFQDTSLKCVQVHQDHPGAFYCNPMLILKEDQDTGCLFFFEPRQCHEQHQAEKSNTP